MKLLNFSILIIVISAQSFLERGKLREKRIWNRRPRKSPKSGSEQSEQSTNDGPASMERALAPGPELTVATNDAVVKADVAEADMSASIEEAEVTFADEGFTSRVIEDPEEIATEDDLPMTSVGERQFNGGSEIADENRKFRPNGNKNQNSKKPNNSKKNTSKKNTKKKNQKNQDPTTTTATTTTATTTTATTTTTSPPVVPDPTTTTASTTTSATTTTETTLTAETTTTETTTTATTSTTTTSTKSTTTSVSTTSSTTVTTLYPPTLDTTLADTTTEESNPYAPAGEPVKNPYGPNTPNNPYSNDDPTTTATTSTTETTTTATTSTKTTVTTTTEDTNIPANPYAGNNDDNGGNGGNGGYNSGGNNNGNDQNSNLPTAAEVEQANAAANQQVSNEAFNAEIQNAAANQQAEAFNAANNVDNNPQDGIADTQFHFEMSCWNCHGRNYLECAANGKMEKCRHPQDGCYLEVRKRGTKFEQVVMGCRPGGVCEQQKDSNFVGNRPMNHQCRPTREWEKYGLPSVCRQCCYFPNCTGDSKQNFWKPQTASEWDSELEKPNKNPYGPNNPNNPYSNDPEPTTAAPPNENDAYIK